MTEKIKKNFLYTEYWETPYEKWGVDTWDSFFYEKYSGSKQKSRSALAVELKVLNKHLKPGREKEKVSILKHNLKVSILHVLGREDANEHSKRATPCILRLRGRRASRHESLASHFDRTFSRWPFDHVFVHNSA